MSPQPPWGGARTPAAAATSRQPSDPTRYFRLSASGTASCTVESGSKPFFACERRWKRYYFVTVEQEDVVTHLDTHG